MAALVDTGILLALANKRDANHSAAVALLSSLAEALLVPTPVLTEAAYLTNRVLGVEAEARLIASLGHGEMQLEDVTRADCLRAADLLRTYAEANIGFVDAVLAAMAERLKIRRVLTVDRRHFEMIRPRHCAGFEILP
jgi:predicted nucleic acid-binding protein